MQPCVHSCDVTLQQLQLARAHSDLNTMSGIWQCREQQPTFWPCRSLEAASDRRCHPVQALQHLPAEQCLRPVVLLPQSCLAPPQAPHQELEHPQSAPRYPRRPHLHLGSGPTVPASPVSTSAFPVGVAQHNASCSASRAFSSRSTGPEKPVKVTGLCLSTPRE